MLGYTICVHVPLQIDTKFLAYMQLSWGNAALVYGMMYLTLLGVDYMECQVTFLWFDMPG
jgi:hypothetical protein